MSDNEIAHLEAVIRITDRRLKALQLKEANLGISAPAELLIEIDDLNEKIKKCQEMIMELKRSALESARLQSVQKDEANKTTSYLAEKTHMTFINRRDEPIKIYWIDNSGDKILYSSLLQGQSFGVQTYVNHAWLVTDVTDKSIGVYVPEKHSTTIVIE